MNFQSGFVSPHRNVKQNGAKRVNWWFLKTAAVLNIHSRRAPQIELNWISGLRCHPAASWLVDGAVTSWKRGGHWRRLAFGRHFPVFSRRWLVAAPVTSRVHLSQHVGERRLHGNCLVHLNTHKRPFFFCVSIFVLFIYLFIYFLFFFTFFFSRFSFKNSYFTFFPLCFCFCWWLWLVFSVLPPAVEQRCRPFFPLNRGIYPFGFPLGLSQLIKSNLRNGHYLSS